MGKKWAAASQKPQKCVFCGTPHKACVEHVPSPSPPPRERVGTRWHRDTEMSLQKKSLWWGAALGAQIPPGAAAGKVPVWFLPWVRR